MKSLSTCAKAGFTLAEVLITLGIIGVVAAMTIPNLMAKITEAQTVTKLKATHSILSNAIRLAEEEYGEMGGWDLKFAGYKPDSIEIANRLKMFLKIAGDCGIGIDSEGMCIPNVYYKRLNGYLWARYSSDNAYYKLGLLNGVSVWWRAASETEFNNDIVAYFFIDVNGKKLPNLVGKDFFFTYEKGSLRPVGAPGHHYSDTCKLSSTG